MVCGTVRGWQTQPTLPAIYVLTLHHKYKDYKVKGEWFELTEKQVENVIQDMNFLQFNEQIFYKTDYSDIPVKSADIDLIRNKLETYLKQERYK
ncbi:MAG: GIY-YIG nuclease family protein, partial [Cuspidothrix sp.]